MPNTPVPLDGPPAANDEISDAVSEAADASDERSDAALTRPARGRLGAAMRFGGWLDRRGVRRGIAAGLGSAVLHVVLLVLVLWLGLFETSIEMEIAWSDDPIQGIGDAAQVATTTVEVDANSPLALTAGEHTQQTAGEKPEPEPEPEPEPAVAEAAPEPPPPEPEPQPPTEPLVVERAEAIAVLDEAAPPEPETAPEPVAAVAEPAEPVEPPEPAEAPKPEPEPEPERVEAPPEPEPEPEPELAEAAPETEAPAPEVSVADDAPLAETAQNIAAAMLGGASTAGAPAQGKVEQRGHVAEALPGLSQFGPGNARLIVLLRNDRLRDTEYEDSVRLLLSRFPHWQISLGKSGIDPLESLDAVLIATPNPTKFADTFLAARHSVDEKIFKLAIKHSYPGGVEWGEHKGRPLARPLEKPGKGVRFGELLEQVVYLPVEGLALYMRPSLLETLEQPAPSATPAAAAAAHAVPDLDPLGRPGVASRVDPIADADPETDAAPPVEDPLAQRTLLETLTAIEQVDAGDGDAPAVFVTVKGITALRFGKKLPELPAPLALDGSVTPGPETTRLVMRLEFADEATAQKFEEAWPGFVDAVGDLMIPGLGGMASAIVIERQGAQIFADGQLNTMFVKLLINFATSALPEVDTTASATP